MALSCPICGSGRVRRKLRKQGASVLQCRDCALAFWRPGEDFDPARLYDGDYFASRHAAPGYDDYAALEPALRATFRRRLARLARPLSERLVRPSVEGSGRPSAESSGRPSAGGSGGPSGARLLDVGAAYGYAASEAERAGFRVAAVELSREAAGQAAALLPGRIARASADRLPFAAESFDVVTLWDVLEHLPDPHRAVAELARCLRPGGRLALTTGDVASLAARISGARWHLYTLPEHLFFHSRESLRRLLGAHGLRVEHMRAEGGLYPVGYLVERLRKTLFGGAASTLRRFPGAGLVIPVNLFDVLTVVAVRLPGD